MRINLHLCSFSGDSAISLLRNICPFVYYASVSSVPQSCPTAAGQAWLSITNPGSPPKPMSMESAMPSNHLILCLPFSLQGSPSIIIPQLQSTQLNSTQLNWIKRQRTLENVNPLKADLSLSLLVEIFIEIIANSHTKKLLTRIQRHSLYTLPSFSQR